MYECKYSRKVGFKPCPLKMRVSFLSHNSQVIVERLEEEGQHVHEEDEESRGQPSSNYRWTEEIYLFIYLMIYKIHLNAPRVVRIHHEEHQVNEPLTRSL